MSRSTRKNPICGMTTAESEKWDKMHWHRRFRRAIRSLLGLGMDQDDLPSFRKFGDPWMFEKDGRQRFDPERWPEGMRK